MMDAEKKNKALLIIYISLAVVCLLLFLPVREALYLSYNSYRGFGLAIALGLAVIGSLLFYFQGDKDSDGIKASLLSFFLLWFVLSILFGGVQFIAEHVSWH